MLVIYSYIMSDERKLRKLFINKFPVIFLPIKYLVYKKTCTGHTVPNFWDHSAGFLFIIIILK